jgi:hypothetical protein
MSGVILSAAKNLRENGEVLRCAQDDSGLRMTVGFPTKP